MGAIPMLRYSNTPKPYCSEGRLDSAAQFLAIPNWEKYQPKLKNGKPNRLWIRMQCNLEDDDRLSRLNLGEYALLTTIWRITGRSGNWVPYDADWLRKRLPSGQHTVRIVRGWLEHIVSIGLLVVCNQQNVTENAPHYITLRNITIKPPKAPRKPKPFAGYTDDFLKVWEPFPKKKDKGAAFKAFQKAGINGNLQQVIDSIEDHKKNDPQWANPQYVPNLATWLNARGWEDELETNQYEFLND